MPHIAIQDDVNLYVVHQGAGTPLLLVHGFPLDHQMWQGQLDGLSAHCHVIAPDLRGFGRSSLPGPAGTSMEQMADDLAILLDRLGIAVPVTLAGLSMGGYIAWQFWRRHRQRLAGLILCDTRAEADTEEVAANRLRVADEVLREGTGVLASMLERLFSSQSLASRQAIVAATEQVIRSAPPQGVAAALRAMAARPDVRAWLSEIDIPTLVLCGEDDEITPVADMRRMAESISGSRFLVIPGCGHMAPLEDPAAVNQAIAAFMGFQTATGS